MKKNLIYAALGLMMLAGCSKNEEALQTVPVKVSAGLNSITRATDANWNKDAIELSVISSDDDKMTTEANKNVKYTTTSTDVKAKFVADGTNILFAANYNGKATFAAYAPYSESLTELALLMNST